MITITSLLRLTPQHITIHHIFICVLTCIISLVEFLRHLFGLLVTQEWHHLITTIHVAHTSLHIHLIHFYSHHISASSPLIPLSFGPSNSCGTTTPVTTYTYNTLWWYVMCHFPTPIESCQNTARPPKFPLLMIWGCLPTSASF